MSPDAASHPAQLPPDTMPPPLLYLPLPHQEPFSDDTICKPSPLPIQEPHCKPTKVDQTALLRKIDSRLLPWLIICYIFSIIDRVNLGNAKIANSETADSLQQSLNLTGLQFNSAVAVFFITYCLFEIPSNLMLKRATPSVWFARIILGMLEAGFYPGIAYYISFWYTAQERATRLAIISIAGSLSGAFGGLLASAISFMNGLGGLRGWQWLFLLEGIPSIILGIFTYWVLPDFPQTAAFLTPEEREYAANRLPPDAPTMTAPHLNWAELKDSLLDPIWWLWILAYFFMNNANNGQGFFTPVIIQNLGFKSWEAQLLTIPPNVFGFFATLYWSWHSDQTKERGLHIITGILCMALGYLILATTTSVTARYLAVFLTTAVNVAIIPFFAFRLDTSRGTTACGVAIAAVVGIGNLGGVTSPYLFPDSTAPNYIPGCWILFGILCLDIPIIYFLKYYYERKQSSETEKGTDLVPTSA
ncbi:hypothetical protein SeMB42_g03648 [Synchytrium endobioticum]|uniref:Major facilitator superfamily (MFS) profile domain-containing protein n=1 Tax=Synchytrium endobioticum TaxID=286115 RepID=A0A507D526_9FUNG|nr:hypothetical protein SeMB42_g03648 [Synchytrium endobioticum]